MSQTRRKGLYGGSLGTRQLPSLLTMKAKRNYNLAHSKSRVANLLSTPGDFKYTNKEAIKAKYERAIQELQTLDKPTETVSAVRLLQSKIDSALQSQMAKETGAVVITIPIGLAQVLAKALRLILSALLLIFVDLPSGFLSGSMTVNGAAAIAPNRTFNTTKKAYQHARQYTGANPNTRVANYR